MSMLLGLGLAQGLKDLPSAVSKGQDAAEERHNKRIEARQRQAQGALQLEMLQRQNSMAAQMEPQKLQAMEMQLAAQTAQNKQLGQKIFREDTYRMLDNYLESGDVAHVNRYLQENKDSEFAPAAFKDNVRVDSIDLKSPEDQNLLTDIGLTRQQLDELDGNADGQIDFSVIQKRFVRVTDANGETSLRDIQTLAVFSGYTKYAKQERLKDLETMSAIHKNNAAAAKSAQVKDTRTEKQKNADHMGEVQKRIKDGTATPADYQFAAAYEQDLGGDKAGKLGLAQNASRQARELGFYDMNQTELQNNPKAKELVEKIELAHELDQAQKKELLELNAMVKLANTAGSLRKEQTGIWDKALGNISKYTDEDWDTTEKNYYGAFINQFRHNLFGSALTEGELEAFADAYGVLGHKIGPVLGGLEAAMVQIESKLNTIANLNEPLVVKYRTGLSVENAKSAVKLIQRRKAMYAAVEKAKAEGQTPAQIKQLIRDFSEPKKQEQKPAANASQMSTDDIANELGL